MPEPILLQQAADDDLEVNFCLLSSYDSPVPPPPLRPCHPVIPPITRDCLLHKESMLEALKPSFKILLEFAQSFCLRVSEHTALDCSMLELLPMLYSHTETEITLHAACDTADPRGRPPASHTLNCAGPAVIYIKVSPACINEGVKRQIETNRDEMDGLLKRSLQAPPSAMCIASIHIEHATRYVCRMAGGGERKNSSRSLSLYNNCCSQLQFTALAPTRPLYFLLDAM
ncbi:Ectopic P granules protein 5 [Homalodisca vitripennis]|nr:Ectopic P granules protein 5 [Homalodisca vitripennis]